MKTTILTIVLGSLALVSGQGFHTYGACNICSIDPVGHTFEAACPIAHPPPSNPDATWDTTSLDLGKCVGLVNGVLVASSETKPSFSDYCTGCTADTSTAILSCQCSEDDGVTVSALTIDLNAFVTSQNGRLSCFQEVATQIEYAQCNA